jgi:hypothetical protein
MGYHTKHNGRRSHWMPQTAADRMRQAKCPHCAFYLYLNGRQVHFPDSCPARSLQAATTKGTR